MSITNTLPSRLAVSHCMICGGTKPIAPTRSRWVAPASSTKSRSRITKGWISGGAVARSGPATNTFDVT